MEKFKCYIYGVGRMYNRISGCLRAHLDYLDILGIVTTDEPEYKTVDNYPCARACDVELKKADYIIIAVEQWKEVYVYLQKLHVKALQILRGTIFEIPNFDFIEYLKLKNNNISIIANTCLAGRVYKELGLEALTPTVNTACVFGEQYLQFINDLPHYISREMMPEFKEKKPITGTFNRELFMPSGQIDEKITWLFPHAESEREAIQKWNTARNKVNMNNVVFLMICLSDDDAIQFDALPLKRKLGFYFKDLHLKSVLYTPEWNNLLTQRKFDFNYAIFIHRYATNIEKLSKIDWISFLNGKEIFLRY